MARALVDARSGALGARTDALERGALVDVGVLDHKVVGAHAVVVLGVGDGGAQRLGDGLGSGARRELEHLERLLDGLVTDLVDDHADLARRHAHVLGGGLDLVVVSHLLHTPCYDCLWPRKVRVGENSPSL